MNRLTGHAWGCDVAPFNRTTRVGKTRRRALWLVEDVGVSAFLCTAAVLSNCLRLHPFLRVLETR